MVARIAWGYVADRWLGPRRMLLALAAACLLGGATLWQAAAVKAWLQAALPELDSVADVIDQRRAASETARRAGERASEALAAAEAAGYDLTAILTMNDLVRSDNCFFAATGISTGAIATKTAPEAHSRVGAAPR